MFVSAPFLFGGRVPSSEDLPTVVDPHFKGFRGGGFVADPYIWPPFHTQLSDGGRKRGFRGNGPPSTDRPSGRQKSKSQKTSPAPTNQPPPKLSVG